MITTPQILQKSNKESFSRLPLEAPTFEEEEKETAVKEQSDTAGKTPSAENGEKKKKKKEKRESSSEMEKEEQGTNKLIKNWENGGQSGSSPQRQVKFLLSTSW